MVMYLRKGKYNYQGVASDAASFNLEGILVKFSVHALRAVFFGIFLFIATIVGSIFTFYFHLTVLDK